MESCSYDGELRVIVHRFPAGLRVCLCGKIVVPECVSRSAWGHKYVTGGASSSSDDDLEFPTPKRYPVAWAN